MKENKHWRFMIVIPLPVVEVSPSDQEKSHMHDLIPSSNCLDVSTSLDNHIKMQVKSGILLLTDELFQLTTGRIKPFVCVTNLMSQSCTVLSRRVLFFPVIRLTRSLWGTKPEPTHMGNTPISLL